MNSWVLLLAALAAGCLRFGSAEGDPLPPSLVELVRTSPIASIDDLQQLLEQETDSQEVEPDEPSVNEIHSNYTHGRYRRNLDAQPAQQAVCKVRTEVMEVTRAMLDRRNANFLLWPPCVEVQRCSGCCNTRMLQCVPTVTQTRYLQVTRIQYINKRPLYDKAVISVEDHTSCRCQTHPSAAAAARSTSLPPPPPRLTPKPPSLSKEDLHRHDDMKANQRFHVDDRGQLERQWQNKYTLSHTQPRTHTLVGTGPGRHTLAGTHTQTHPMAGAGTQVGTHTQTGPSSEHPIGHGSGYEGGRGEERGSQTPHRTHTDTHTDTQPNTGERHHIDNTERTQEIERQQQLQQYYQQQQQYLQQQQQYQQQQHQQQHHQQQQQQQYQPYSQEPELRTQYKHNAPQSDSSGPPDTKQPANHKPELVHSNTEPTNDNDSSTEVANRDALKDTEVTSQRQAATNHRKEDDKEQHSQTELSNQEQRHSESTNHKHRGSELANQGDSVTEEESRKKLLELLQRELGQKQQHHPPHPHLPHQDHHHRHHHQSRTQTTTTQRPVPPTLSSSRAPGWPPSTPSPPPKPPQGPFRPALPRRRRRRKHRSRISKAALRTMIM